MSENEKLISLYNECVYNLKAIGIDILDESVFGKIDIKIAGRNCKRYGCCKQENPDKRNYVKKIYNNRKYIIYEKYNIHHIEISKWVLNLEDAVIKNTIMHELIHCIPKCNNHGKEFKYYASYINNKLGYNISRLGNKKEDFKKSNIEYDENNEFNYKVTCKNCGQTFLRKRIAKNFLNKYRCGICNSKFIIER